ncbi:protein of unknown function (plasmid) [Cupriavidus neocaledonicus]|uniref:Uncharacterized protein n=1 Tax=Cupriavidus neocaledonicus TaxID=1040979 RepID=A0A375HS20_9BURK|nr:protein of unknown function [Cupriavidus neocaledonicus]
MEVFKGQAGDVIASGVYAIRGLADAKAISVCLQARKEGCCPESIEAWESVSPRGHRRRR